MNQSESNPAENKLPSGMKEAELVRSITTSGFPLQGVVAHHLRANYGVTEEWSYIDRDTKDLRSLDVFAFRRLATEDSVTPNAALLIECKSSIHPYVFFQNAVNRPFPFPTLCGLRSVNIRQQSGREGTHQECRAALVLGLAETPFGDKPPVCSAFTQAIANGDKVNVSGTDPFNSIVMPLVKATDHAIMLYNDRRSANDDKLFPALILNVCVMDAPMIVVGNPDDAQSVRLEPWVRVLRQEAKPDNHRVRYAHYVVDVVHRGFLNEFFDTHVEEFLGEYSRRLFNKADILRSGGVVPDLDNWTWKDVSGG
jgi:hypothetical protein